jgi:hypothetical protein
MELIHIDVFGCFLVYFVWGVSYGSNRAPFTFSVTPETLVLKLMQGAVIVVVVVDVTTDDVVVVVVVIVVVVVVNDSVNGVGIGVVIDGGVD